MNRIPQDWIDLLRGSLTEDQARYLDQAYPRYQQDYQTIQKHAPGRKLLEIGSYPYAMTAFLQKSGFEVTGVDKKISRGNQVIADFSLDVEECDIEVSPFPFESETFDFIVCTEVIEHLRIDPLFTLSEIRRCLKKGGRMLLTTPNLYGVTMVARYLTGKGIEDPLHAFNMLKTTGHMGHLRTYTRKNICDMIEHAGLTVISSAFRLIETGSKPKIRRKKAVYKLIPKRCHDNIVILAGKPETSLV